MTQSDEQNQVYVPAAPGTRVVYRVAGGKLEPREAVIAWRIGKVADTIAPTPVTLRGEPGDDWQGVQFADGSIDTWDGDSEAAQ